MNKLFAIIIMCSLSLPVLAIDEQEVGVEPQDNNTVEEVTSNEKLLPPGEQDFSTTYKQPTSKKKLAKKFLIAMLCVAGTSVFLYGVLSIYNKVRDGLISQSPLPPEGEKPLDTPVDLTEAVRTFIDKTRWNG